MDAPTATLLAAVVSAVVVALTFAVTEVLKYLQSRRVAKADAFGALLAALEDYPLAPEDTIEFTRGARRLTAVTARLMPTIPARHRHVIVWFLECCSELVPNDPDDEVPMSGHVIGQMTAVAIGYLTTPRAAARTVEEMRRAPTSGSLGDRVGLV